MTGKEAVRQAFRMGFYTEAAVFPVFVPGEEHGTVREVNTEKRRAAERPHDQAGIPDDYLAASDAAGCLPKERGRELRGLEALFAPGLFLKDRDCDGLADELDLVICIPERADSFVLAAACNLAFRFGMETTAYTGSLVRYVEEGIPKENNTLVFEAGEDCGIFFEQAAPAGPEAYKAVYRVRITGQGEALTDFVSGLCGKFPLQPEGRDWETVLSEIQGAFRLENEDGELLFCALGSEGAEGVDAYVSPHLAGRTRELEEKFPQISFYNYKAGKKVYEKSYTFPWEKEVLEQILEEKVYPRLRPGDVLSVEAALSEEKSVRDDVRSGIMARARTEGASVDHCRVLCAYKQGYSWIREEVLPSLAEKEPARVEISFTPFLPEGAQETDEENGALPSYNNIGAGDPEAWYDLAIRPLQELYPIRDEIERALGIARDAVTFTREDKTEGSRMEDSQAEDSRTESPPGGHGEEVSFRFCAWDEHGHEIFSETYETSYGERPFLDAFPEMGKVHPFTGYVRAWINGECVLSKRVRTDLEEIWDAFQTEVLPACTDYLESKHPEGICAKDQPLFSKLLLDVEASEPDERLGSREDLFSSLDALHEDLYFVGSDYFKNYGLKKTGELLDAPGLILPVIKKREGQPKFRAVLYDRVSDGLCVKIKDKTLRADGQERETSLFMKSVEERNGRTVVTLKTDAPKEWVHMLCSLISDGLSETCRHLSGVDLLRFEAGGSQEGDSAAEDEVFEAEIPRWEEEKKDLKITDIDLMENRLIGYDEYMDIVRKLTRVPGISVYRTALSYEGREVYAIELLPQQEGYVSRTKRLTMHPSMIINARHHANEVSSTNALLILLKKILTEKKYEDLSEKLNLILVPMENVDGTAIHYELQKENPYWKLHVARFNAVGKEFYNEYFHDDTIHTEAHCFTKLWKKALPDIVVDDHGVPTHEWEQQFSGYTSPSYKGFWLPRSLLYGYFWYVSDEKYRSNYTVNKALEEVVADAVGEHPEIVRWNREWADQFETYAHAWMPGLFPADYYKGMINYWIPFESDPAHRYPSIRFPWITTVAYTSEVADETAQGEYLNLCARTHVVHDEAAIRMMTDQCICVMEDTYREDGDTMTLKLIRKRPVVIEKK